MILLFFTKSPAPGHREFSLTLNSRHPGAGDLVKNSKIILYQFQTESGCKIFSGNCLRNRPPKNSPKWSELVEIVLGSFWGPTYQLFVNNDFQSYLKVNGLPSMKLRLKKIIYKGFTVKAKLAFFALIKKRRFSRPIFDPTQLYE